MTITLLWILSVALIVVGIAGTVLPALPGTLFVLAGIVLLIVGYIWGLQFPVIKRIWTSTYVLVAGGYCLLLLAAFYYVVDILRWRKWATPFLWIGANAIIAYVLASIAPWEWLMGPFANWLAVYCGGVANVLAAAVVPGLVILLMYVMYRKQWYLRV